MQPVSIADIISGTLLYPGWYWHLQKMAVAEIITICSTIETMCFHFHRECTVI